jgi:hypothetical protein
MFSPKDAGYRFFQNCGTFLPKYTLPHPIRTTIFKAICDDCIKINKTTNVPRQIKTALIKTYKNLSGP